jgi:hypothetical protein
MKKYYVDSKRKGTSYIQKKERKKHNWIGHILRRNYVLKELLKNRWKDRSDGQMSKKM